MLNKSPHRQEETVVDCLKGFVRDAERHERSRHVYEVTKLTVDNILKDSSFKVAERISSLKRATIRLRLTQFVRKNTDGKWAMNEDLTEIERVGISLKTRHLVNDLKVISGQGEKANVFEIAA